MAAPQQNRTPREVLDFPPNVPVALALKYAQGRKVSNQYGERIMLTTVQNQVAFLDLDVAAKIEALGINVREPFTVIKRTDGKKDSPVTWDVQRTIVPGEQPNGTYVVPTPASAARSQDAGSAGSVTPKPPASATAAVNDDARARGAAVLVAESIALVDAYAQVLDHALTQHNGRVKPDEVKSIFLTCVINLAGGKTRAA